MNISYDGIGYLAVTMPTNGCREGGVCKLNSEGFVEFCSSGEQFFGVVVFADESMAHVQLEGFVKVPYTGTVPAAGLIKLVADSDGGVAVNSNGREHLVVSVDPEAQTIVMKL